MFDSDPTHPPQRRRLRTLLAAAAVSAGLIAGVAGPLVNGGHAAELAPAVKVVDGGSGGGLPCGSSGPVFGPVTATAVDADSTDKTDSTDAAPSNPCDDPPVAAFGVTW